jgi:hypothetical protein
MMRKSRVLGPLCILVFLSLSSFSAWSQFYSVAEYTWSDEDTIPVFIEIPGTTVTTIHQVVLKLDTNGNSNDLDFYLTDPDGNTDVVKPGFIYNTEVPAGSEKNIRLIETDTLNHVYELTIAQNPAGSGVFGQDEVWGITVSNLGGSHTLEGTMTSRDTDLDPIEPSPAKLIPNGLYCIGESPMNYSFTIPGDMIGDIHKVILHVKTDGSPVNFSIVGSTYGSGNATATEIDQLAFAALDQDFGGTTSGTHLELIDGASSYLRFEITANPTGCDAFTSDCEFDHEEIWQFVMNGLSAGNKTLLSIETQRRFSASTLVISPDPVELQRPALAIITKPSNEPPSAPTNMVINREFRYESDPFDTDTADASLTYLWEQTPGTFDVAHDSEQNPDFNEAFVTTTPQTIELSVTESYPLNVDLGDPYIDFTYTTKDKIEMNIVQPEYVLFTPHRNLPYTSGGPPPVIDGTVTTDFDTYTLGDTGWNQAHLILYQDGTIPHVAFQSLCDRSDDFLYMSFEVRNDGSVDDEDVILLAFSGDTSAATPADDLILLIYPFSTDGQAPDEDFYAAQVRLKTWNSATSEWEWENLTGSQADANYDLEAKVKSNFSSPDAWNVELKIPTSPTTGGPDWITINNQFLFYFNVFRVYDTGTSKDVSEFYWPQAITGVLGEVENYDYNPGVWGEAIQGYTDVTAYNGLYFTRNDIKVTPTIDGVTGSAGRDITLPDCADADTTNDSVINMFEVTLYNDFKVEKETGPEYYALKDLQIAFSIAKWWGIPGPTDWIKIPSHLDTPPVDNPVTGGTIGAGSDSAPATSTITLDWNIACGESTPDPTDLDDDTAIANYQPPDDHQCVYVEILGALVDDPTATAPELQPVNILTRGIYQNMDFVTASELKRKAVISGRGYGSPLGGSDKHRFTIIVSKHDWAREGEKGKRLSVSGSTTSTSYLYWSASGYRHTGQSVIIKGKPFELVEPAGSFGYVVEHEGEVNRWVDDIEGAKEVAEDTYELEIPPEAVASVITHIKPVEPLGLSLSLHAGAAVPLPPSSFAGDYKTGFCVIGDIGYKITDRFSIMGLFGYNYFPAKSSSMDDASVLNIAVNGKYFIPVRSNMDIGIGLGPELFVHDFNSVEFGYDLDVSYDWRLSRRLTLELGAIYHSHFDQEVWFLQPQVGVIVGF